MLASITLSFSPNLLLISIKIYQALDRLVTSPSLFLTSNGSESLRWSSFLSEPMSRLPLPSEFKEVLYVPYKARVLMLLKASMRGSPFLWDLLCFLPDKTAKPILHIVHPSFYLIFCTVLDFIIIRLSYFQENLGNICLI